MKFTPYEYQKTAIEWVVDKPHCGLFLDMGLGKSVITLTAVSRLIDYGDVEKALVVAPKKVAESTWGDEVRKWDHLRGMRVSKILGSAKQRTAAMNAEADIYVTGRDNFVWLCRQCKGKLPYDMIVIDELTSFKSPKSARFKAMRIARASVSRVVGLTGTPAPNGLADLWAQLCCIDGGERLGRSVTRYRDAYFDQHRWNNIVVRMSIKKGADRVIRDRIADICLSMQARDFLDLPGLTVHKTYVDMDEKTAKAYREFEREKVLEFRESVKGDEPQTVIAQSAAALMNKLSQFANGAVYDEERSVHEIHGAKLDALAETVEAAQGSGVLIFYQYRHDAERIMRRLKGVKAELYSDAGSLKRWNDGNIEALLAHPASTAFGLNMQQGGHYIVWFGTGWNLELYQQANARLHRQGQTHPVTVYQLLTRGTVDERASAALDDKKGVQQGLMDSLNYLLRTHGA